ncbi:MAG: polymer-forming cytoskeletal protein [Candidatus Atribacteria bacterium]|nr:polymer-forming cytoskeletal protein [Candidatus Atribacteria bacterium]
MDWNSLICTWSDKIRSQSNQHFIETVIKKHPVELYLPENTFFEGSIHVDGLFRLEGKVNGKIHCPIVIIAEKALVTAEVEAYCLYIEGHFRGIARVSFLYLSKLGRCEGNIKTNCIFVEEGARMQSKVTIEKGGDNLPQSKLVKSSENQ